MNLSSRSSCLRVLYAQRRLAPRRDTDPGVRSGNRPSPPPCGWSTGFITEPRTVGRMPMWRLRPALPMRHVLVVDVADLADDRLALQTHQANLARGQADLGVFALLGHELRRRCRRCARAARPCRGRAPHCGSRCPPGCSQCGRQLPGLMSAVGRADHRVAHLEAVEEQ